MRMLVAKTATAEEGLGYTQSPTPFIQVVDDPGINITVKENKIGK